MNSYILVVLSQFFPVQVGRFGKPTCWLSTTRVVRSPILSRSMDQLDFEQNRRSCRRSSEMPLPNSPHTHKHTKAKAQSERNRRQRTRATMTAAKFSARQTNGFLGGHGGQWRDRRCASAGARRLAVQSRALRAARSRLWSGRGCYLKTR